MKRMNRLATGIAVLAGSALAQDPVADLVLMRADLEKALLTSKVYAATGVMGKTVKGAPYSGEEINESLQVLADGTRIRNENRTKVFRDSDGRVRRETGENVTIWDPVASVSYTLDTKSMTGVKSPMNALFTRAVATSSDRAGVAAGGFAGRGRLMEPGQVSVKDGVVTWVHDGKTETFPVGPDGSWTSPDGRLRGFSSRTSTNGPGHHGVREVEMVHGSSADHLVMEEKVKLEAANARVAYAPVPMARNSAPNSKNEDLGEQVMEGVKVRGTRQTWTIEAGAIGNDRPLNTVNERWASDDLQTEVMTRRSDPRTGEATFRLVNITRGEQAAYLFQPPNGYNITERPGPGGRGVGVRE